jgi:hypothetical protein
MVFGMAGISLTAKKNPPDFDQTDLDFFYYYVLHLYSHLLPLMDNLNGLS